MMFNRARMKNKIKISQGNYYYLLYFWKVDPLYGAFTTRRLVFFFFPEQYDDIGRVSERDRVESGQKKDDYRRTAR